MTLQDLFILEDIRGNPTVDPSTGTPAMFKMGLHPADKKSIFDLIDDQQLNEIEDLTVRYITLSQGNSPVDEFSAKFIMINGIPIYLMEGKVTSAIGASPPYVVTYFDTANKPSIAAFLEGDNSMKSYVKGLVAQAMTITFETGMDGLLCQMSHMGMGHGLSDAVPTSTYPDSITEPFNLLTHWKWNTTAYAIKAININWTEKLSGLIGDSGYYQYIGTTAPILNIITVNFKDGVDVTVIKADMRAATSRTLEVKFAKASNSTTLYWTRSASYKCEALQWMRFKGMPDQLIGIFKQTGAPTNTIADGITTDSFYGLSA
jgi:hypothetical protein